MPENSFNKLVTGLSFEERMALLKKIEAMMGSDAKPLEAVSHGVPEETAPDLSSKLQKESIFIKFFIWLRSFFLGLNREFAYNGFLIRKKVLALQSAFPSLLNWKKRLFADGFYSEFKNLKQIADYFEPFIALYEEDKNEFYLFLSTLVLPTLFNSLQEDINVQSNSRQSDANLRQILLHKLEEIFNGISTSDRNKLYSYVQAADWLRQFVRLPFHRVLGRFFSVPNDGNVCEMNSLQSELPVFAKILCNSPSIRSELLEALVLYYFKKRNLPVGQSIELTAESEVADGEPLDAKPSPIEAELNKMVAHFTAIKDVNQNLPLRDICVIAFNDYNWSVPSYNGVENWFYAFKTQWKLFFESQWEELVAERQRAEMFAKFRKFWGDDIPHLQHRPWENAWCELSFPFDLSLGFLTAFFQKYASMMESSLKILLSEGDFCLKKNAMEFTDAFNNFNYVNSSLTEISYSISPAGNIGQYFADSTGSGQHTLQERNKMAAQLISLKNDAEKVFTVFFRMAKTIENIIKGIISGSHDNYFATLYNLTKIQGKNNIQFRENLLEISELLHQASEITIELYKTECLNDKK